MTHFIPCPLCGQARPEFARYPLAVCSACAAQASSADGRRLRFEKEGLSGGLKGSYAEDGGSYASPECFIGGVRCRAEEARFGGVVIQVVPVP